MKALIAVLTLVLLTGCLNENRVLNATARVTFKETKDHGSAFLIGPRLALTAAHVVKGEGGLEKQVFLTFGKKVVGAEVVWVGTGWRDVALLKLHEDPDVFPLKVACGSLPINTPLMATGYPLNAPLALYKGHVAASEPYSPEEPVRLVQVPVVSGMSGGPVVGPDGDVVGITLAMFMMPIRMGGFFPVPSATGTGFILEGKHICEMLAR